MLEWFITSMRAYPALAIFLTLGLGFVLGRIKFGQFQLGSVTAVLLVGVAVGQIDIEISGPIKSFFFMMFLFSIGYKVGPDFFKTLRGSGLKQALFAVIMSSSCCVVTLVLAWLFMYSKGETLGLFSGSQTCSALLGVGGEAIQKIGLAPEVLKRELDIIPVCYAVTYIYGTLGTIIILGTLGPRMLGGVAKVREKALEMEAELHSVSTADKPKHHTHHQHNQISDIAFIGLCIFLGGLFGLMTLWINEIPLSFGSSGGALLSGLFFGWLRRNNPKHGHIPDSVLWFMNNMGLNVFIAVVGLSSATSFVTGLKEVGPMLLLIGAVATTLPLFFGIWLGNRVFKFNPAITLGCCAGTRTCTAALGAVQSTIGSAIPTIGYTVTYAVSNVMLMIWGLVTVLVAP